MGRVHSILKDIYLIENSAWCRFVRYSDIPGLSVTSNPLSPIVFLKLKNSTGSFEKDLKLLEDIVNHVKLQCLCSVYVDIEISASQSDFLTNNSAPFPLSQVLKEDSVLLISSIRSTLDK